MKTLYFLISILSISSIALADFKSQVALENSKAYRSIKHTQELRRQLQPVLSQRHMVYVAGFLNEGLPLQFVKNIETLNELGIGATTRIYPSSTKSVSETADNLLEQLTYLYNNGNEKGQGKGLPIILIGHSKGGAEVVLAVIKHPSLIQNKIVDKVVAMQSGFKTPLAEISRIGQLCRYILSPCYMLKNVIDNGLYSMKASIAEPVFHEAIEQLKNSGQFNQVSSSIFYVRSHQTILGGLAPGMAATYAYMRKVSGENDGIIPLKDQYIYAVGNDLGPLDADHAELILHSNALVYGEVIRDFQRTRGIKAFTRALMTNLYLTP